MVSIRPVSPLQSKDICGVRTSPVHDVSVEQVRNSLQVGLPGPRGNCSACGRDLHDGHCVTVYAYKSADASEWEIPRVYCRGCHGNEIRTPTLGTREVVATAFLGLIQLAASQTARLSLTEVELQTHSPPTEGTEP